MITAHKYLNLDLSVINISALIIDKLKKNSLLKYDELLSLILSNLGLCLSGVLWHCLGLCRCFLDSDLDSDADAFKNQWLQLLNNPFIPDPTPLISDTDRHRDRLQEAFRQT